MKERAIKRGKVGDPLPSIAHVDASTTIAGPRCFLCNRLFLAGNLMMQIAVDQEREHFADGARPGPRIQIGADCLKYVPFDSVAGQVRRAP